MIRDSKKVIDLSLLDDGEQVENITVEDWYNSLIEAGVDPEEEHIVLSEVHKDGESSVVKEVHRGPLLECLVAASKAEGFIHVMPMCRYPEVSRSLN